MTTQPEATEPPEPETHDSATRESDDVAAETHEPEDTERLDHAEALIDEARGAVSDALPEKAGDDNLDAPSTSEGLPDDEPVTPGPN